MTAKSILDFPKVNFPWLSKQKMDDALVYSRYYLQVLSQLSSLAASGGGSTFDSKLSRITGKAQ